jgi:hypothetical protein
MRWPPKNNLKFNDKRIVKKFLWFPRNLNEDQYRWLEYANIEEIVRVESCLGIWRHMWKEMRFV